MALADPEAPPRRGPCPDGPLRSKPSLKRVLPMPTDRNQPSRCPGVSRRSFLVDTGMGFTGLALGAMLFRDGRARAAEAVNPPAKAVIWIFLCGGVSHVESFDVKPALNDYAG